MIAEDVGVLQQQRAPADGLERVPERPHLVAVDVDDRADRARPHVAGRVADGDRRARPQRLRREAPSGPAGTASTGRPAFAAAVSSASRQRRAQPADGQRRPAARACASAAPSARRFGLAAPHAPSPRPRGLPGASTGRAEDRLDRRRQRDLAAVLADRLARSRRSRAARPRRPGSRSASPRSPGRSRSRPPPARTPDQDAPGPRVASPSATSSTSTSNELIVRPLDHRVARAVHARVHLRQRHDRVARGNAGAAGTSRAATAAASGRKRMKPPA